MFYEVITSTAFNACVAVLIWMFLVVDIYRVRARFMGPIPKNAPVLLMIMFIAFVSISVVLYYFFSRRGHLDIFCFIEAFMIISSTILILMILRQRRSQGGRNEQFKS